MLSTVQRKEILNQLNEVRTEIKDLKRSLNELNDQKESWFSKKEKTSTDISRLLQSLKEHRIKRDTLTKDVRINKKMREELNKKLKVNVAQIKGLETQKKDIAQKYNIKGDPSRIKQEIEKLDTQVETNVMSFEKEKELMKQIRELKKKLGDAKEVTGFWEKINALSKETSELKRNADALHKKVQDQASASQEKHETMMTVAESLDKHREQEKQEFEKFVDFKKKFVDVNSRLKVKLTDMGNLNTQLDSDKKALEVQKKEDEVKTLKNKEEEIEDKIKTGKKITTKDLLIFQSQN